MTLNVGQIGPTLERARDLDSKANKTQTSFNQLYEQNYASIMLENLKSGKNEYNFAPQSSSKKIRQYQKLCRSDKAEERQKGRVGLAKTYKESLKIDYKPTITDQAIAAAIEQSTLYAAQGNPSEKNDNNLNLNA